MSAATPRVLDMSESDRTPEEDTRILNSRGRLMTGKQIRARARRAVGREGKRNTRLEISTLHKPVEDWDMEELARGRPRGADGTFRGKIAKYVTREVHEAAMSRFKNAIRAGMNANAVQALATMDLILSNNDLDDKGKPVIPPSVKLQASQYLLDHVVGRSVQPTQTEISVKLQAILGSVMVSPTEDGGFQVGQFAPRAIGGSDEIILDEEDYEDDDEG